MLQEGATMIYLFRRGAVYCCRIPVPKDIQPFIDRKEFWKSLGASSLSDAQHLSASFKCPSHKD